MALGVLFGRRAPLLFLVGTVALAVPLSDRLTSPHTVTLTGSYVLIVPLLTVAILSNRLRSLIGLAILFSYALGVGTLHDAPAANILSGSLFATGVWAVGRVIRNHRQLATDIRLASAQLAAGGFERERHAVVSERTTIARDLHALVARGVVSMVVQAEAARDLVDHDPGAATTMFTSIENAGREALTQMRHILGVLRARVDDVDLSPQPGIDQLPALVQRARAAGTPVELTIYGERRQLDPGADLITYRIVEEVLDGAHGPVGDPIVITLYYDVDMVEIEVGASNLSPARWPSPTMRERVAICDGEIEFRREDPGQPRFVVRLPHVLRLSMA
jgi:signal transduction histidine kinase